MKKESISPEKQLTVLGQSTDLVSGDMPLTLNIAGRCLLFLFSKKLCICFCSDGIIVKVKL